MGDKIKVCVVRNDDSCVYNYFIDYPPKGMNYDIFEVDLPEDFKYIGKNCKDEQLIEVQDVDGYTYNCRVDELFMISKSNDIFIDNPMIYNYKPKKCKYKKLNDEMCYDAMYL